jgi:hypothetical protein
MSAAELLVLHASTTASMAACGVGKICCVGFDVGVCPPALAVPNIAAKRTPTQSLLIMFCS